jgi:S-formylglutathione hydrolase FrmB
VRIETFDSASLGRLVDYVVDWPDSYASGSARYPVVYVLHGLFEGPTFWTRRGLDAEVRSIRLRLGLPEVIVVAVDGGNSFFVNTPESRYQDLVTDDIVAHVEANYRVIPGREARGLLGISMGGYAALRIAFTRPEVFGTVVAHSAMLLGEIPSSTGGARPWHMRAFSEVFGDPIDPALWREADPMTWAGRADLARLPALRFDCGAEDRFGLAAGNLALHRLLESRGVAHEFALPPGDHGYEYVRSVLSHSLRFLTQRLAMEIPPTPAH